MKQKKIEEKTYNFRDVEIKKSLTDEDIYNCPGCCFRYNCEYEDQSDSNEFHAKYPELSCGHGYHYKIVK